VFIAASKKPESAVTSDETDWKKYGFNDILNKGVEEENNILRRKLGGIETLMAARDDVHEAVKSELEMATQNIATLNGAYTSSLGWAKSRESENRMLKKKLQELYSKYDSLKGKGGAHHNEVILAMENVSTKSGTKLLGLLALTYIRSRRSCRL